MSTAFQEQTKISNENQKFVTISFKPLSFSLWQWPWPFHHSSMEEEESYCPWEAGRHHGLGNKKRCDRNGQLGLLKNGVEDLRKNGEK